MPRNVFMVIKFKNKEKIHFRLNYPLKMRKWHHACTSWNGKTGEWQLWIKAERVGRGFHNRVSHKIFKFFFFNNNWKQKTILSSKFNWNLK